MAASNPARKKHGGEDIRLLHRQALLALDAGDHAPERVARGNRQIPGHVFDRADFHAAEIGMATPGIRLETASVRPGSGSPDTARYRDPARTRSRARSRYIRIRRIRSRPVTARTSPRSAASIWTQNNSQPRGNARPFVPMPPRRRHGVGSRRIAITASACGSCPRRQRRKGCHPARAPGNGNARLPLLSAGSFP